MLFNTRKFFLSFVLSFMLLPAMVFASTEYKGTETVNINKANAATLAAYLKGIGANKAEAIVKYRKSNGNFKSAAGIKDVPGIGDATYKDIKSKISTSRGKSSAPKGYKIGETSGKSTSTKKKSSSSKKSTSSKSSKSSKTKDDSTTKKSSSSKSKSSKAADKKSSSKSKSSKTKAKKESTSKKTATSKKKSSSKDKKKSKKTSSKKKKTVKCKKSQKKVKGKCVAK